MSLVSSPTNFYSLNTIKSFQVPEEIPGTNGNKFGSLIYFPLSQREREREREREKEKERERERTNKWERE